MYPLARLQRLYQVRSFRMLDTAKKRDVTLLYWMPAGGFFLARNLAGELFSGFGTDCTVKSARWSFVKKRLPVLPSGSSASSAKIVTGISTVAPVLGITYLRHSALSVKAVAGTRLKTKTTNRGVGSCSVTDSINTIIPFKFPFGRLVPGSWSVRRYDIRKFARIRRPVAIMYPVDIRQMAFGYPEAKR